MGKMFNLKKIDFKTKQKPSDIIEIAKFYIDHQDEIYEIDENSIVYDQESHVTKKPVWYISVISLKTKEIWPDAYDTLAVSDDEGRLVYVMNDHGVVVELY